MKLRIPAIWIMIIFILPGCEKEYPWDFNPGDGSHIVVDGIITNEMQAQQIWISRTHEDLNDSLRPLSGASVSVSDGNTVYEFRESQHTPGLYQSDSFQVVVNREYFLQLIYASDTIEATASAAPVTPLAELAFIYDSVRQVNRFYFNERGSPSMIEVCYDWSGDSSYCSEYGSCFASETYYVLHNVDISAVFPPDKQTIYFPGSTWLIRKKYSLSDAHQDYVRSLLMESEWSGGMFDVQHGNLVTNLSNGALGFFGACMVVSDTAFIE